MSIEPVAGGAKKFLYISSVNNKNTEIDNSRHDAQAASKQSPRGKTFDVGNVWSIKNVGLTSKNTSAGLPRSGLNKNVPTAYYSRHGGFSGQTVGSSHGDKSSRFSGAKWTSSGHNYSPSSQIRPLSGTPSPRIEIYSPLDRDINDF